MTPDLFWIPTDTSGRLAISARPRGGDWLPSEVAGWRQAGVDVVVSMLTPEEEIDLELTDEGNSCKAAGVEFITVPVPDREIPATGDDFAEADAAEAIRDGATVAVHCRQGIGRSALFAVAVLKTLGWSTDTAVRAASTTRGRSVPETREQLAWLHRFTPTQPATAGVP